MENNTFPDSLYASLLLLTFVQQLISLVGIIFNCTLVWVIFRHKSLHRTYSFLLAICSFSDAMMESSAFLTTILVLFFNQIPLLTCFWAQLHSNIGSMISLLCIFFIAFDRLLGVAFPFFYQFTLVKHSNKYLALILLIISLICLWNFTFFYNSVKNSDEFIFCFIGDSYRGEKNNYFFNFYVAILLATVGIYAIIWILLKFKHNSNDQIQEQSGLTRRVFKSLTVILAVIICCWLFSFLAHFTFNIIEDINQRFLAINLSIQLIVLAGAINLPVLYFCSSDYRKAIQSEFKSLHSFGIGQQQSWAISRIQPMHLAPH